MANQFVIRYKKESDKIIYWVEIMRAHEILMTSRFMAHEDECRDLIKSTKKAVNSYTKTVVEASE